jgi:putative ABC transport system permease protein
MTQSRSSSGYWLDSAVADVKYAIRSVGRRPGFAVAAAVCLAIGIGANALIFSLVNGVLLRPLPYPDADRIVMIRFTPPGQPDQRLGTNRGVFRFLRDHNRSFEHIGELRSIEYSIAAGPSGDSEREWVLAGWTGPGVTRAMGVQPILGRWFAPTDTDFGVVISYGVWQRLFGGGPDVVGKTLRLDTVPATVIGVMPRDYRTLDPNIQVWRLQGDSDGALRSPNRVFNIFARLKPDVTIAQAQAEMDALATPLGEYMEMHRGWGIKVDSLRDAYVGHLKRPIIVLQAAVVLLLLIACANVAGLLLAHASTRQREFATRAALGSTRLRMVRQMATESLLLSAFGGVLGIAFAWAGMKGMLGSILSAYRDLQDVSLDWTVLGAAAVVSVISGLLFGVLPAWHSSRFNLTPAMRDGSRGLTAGVRTTRTRGLFVVAQLALAFVLVAGTGLLARSLTLLNAVDTGLDARNVLAVELPFSRSLYKGAGSTPSGGLMVEFDSRFSDLTERLRERLATLPGVVSATTAVTPPLAGTPWRMRFGEGRFDPAAPETDGRVAEWYPVSPAYFETLRIPVLRGRGITADDRESSRQVAVINATMARRYWPNDDPIGRRLQVDLLDDQPREIVGIVGDVTQDRFQSSAQPQLYVPRAQLPHRMDMTLSLDALIPTFLVRTAGDPVSVLPAVRAAVADLNPTFPISNVRTVEDYAAAQLAELSQYATVLGLFGMLSVALAVVGIVGVMAQAVGHRTREFGLRLAVGAQPRNVMALVLRQATTLVVLGLAAGVGASAILLPAIRRLLWGVSATDFVTLIAAVISLAVIALAACYIPARRAMRVDPVVVLRAE